MQHKINQNTLIFTTVACVAAVGVVVVWATSKSTQDLEIEAHLDKLKTEGKMIGIGYARKEGLDSQRWFRVSNIRVEKMDLSDGKYVLSYEKEPEGRTVFIKNIKPYPNGFNGDIDGDHERIHFGLTDVEMHVNKLKMIIGVPYKCRVQGLSGFWTFIIFESYDPGSSEAPGSYKIRFYRPDLEKLTEDNSTTLKDVRPFKNGFKGTTPRGLDPPKEYYVDDIEKLLVVGGNKRHRKRSSHRRR